TRSYGDWSSDVCSSDLERRTDLFAEELRLFPGGEVPALVDLVEVDDVWVGLLDPAARRPPDLAGECGEAERDRRRRQGLQARGQIGRASCRERVGSWGG